MSTNSKRKPNNYNKKPTVKKARAYPSSRSAGSRPSVNMSAAQRQARNAAMSLEEYRAGLDKKKKRYSKSAPVKKVVREHTVVDQELREKKARNAAKRRKRKLISFIVLMSLIVITAVVICVLIFFKVSSISVTGNEKYTSQQVINKVDLETGDNLFLFNRDSVADNLERRCPYIVDVRFKISLSGKVTIVVSETQAAFAFPTGEKQKGKKEYCLTAYNGKVLELTYKKSKNPIYISGADIKSSKIGSLIVLEDDKVMSHLTDILKTAKESGFTNITAASVNANAYSFVYDGRYTVKLGSVKDLEYKCSLAFATVQKLDKENGDQTGIIDVRNAAESKNAYFTAS